MTASEDATKTDIMTTSDDATKTNMDEVQRVVTTKEGIIEDVTSDPKDHGELKRELAQRHLVRA